MIFIPQNILQLMNNDETEHETIIYQNDYFLVVEDLKHQPKSYYYTAWIKRDIRSIIEIDADILEKIKQLEHTLIKKELIKSDHLSFVHFPPNYWRLHVHFVANNHQFKAPKHEILPIAYIINCYQHDANFFKTNIRIYLNSNKSDNQDNQDNQDNKKSIQARVYPVVLNSCPFKYLNFL